MKRMWIILVMGLLTLGISAVAVDVKEKDTTKTPAVKAEPPKVKKPIAPPAQSPNLGKQPPKSGKTQTTEKKYDDFIDLNHNGIDDRKENLVKK